MQNEYEKWSEHERLAQEAAYDAYMTARAEYELKGRHVMCDLCDAEDYGPAKVLEANGWELTSNAAFCWRHGGH